MGSSYGTSSTGTVNYTGSEQFVYDYTGIHNLTLGMLGMNSFNGGFDSLSFNVNKNGTPYNYTFATLASAQNFFTDNALGLGTFNSNLNLLVSYDLTASASKGANFSYLVATAPVPEPETWIMLLLGIGLLGLRLRAKGRSVNPFLQQVALNGI
jgi:hypothetical protein